MIAIPIKEDDDNSNLSKKFGKAKYFALINNNKIEILKNDRGNGKAVANWLKSKNVNIVIASQVKEKSFNALKNYGISVYFTGSTKIKIQEALLKYADGDVPVLNKLNYLCHAF